MIQRCDFSKGLFLIEMMRAQKWGYLGDAVFRDVSLLQTRRSNQSLSAAVVLRGSILKQTAVTSEDAADPVP